MGQRDGQIAITFNAPLTAGGISSHSSTGGQRLHHFCRLVNTAENAVFKSRLKTFHSPRLSLLSLLTNTLPGPSTCEVMTSWRYTNLFIIIIIDRNHGQVGACLSITLKKVPLAVGGSVP